MYILTYSLIVIHGLLTIAILEGSHFQGGTITYKIMEIHESTITISVLQTYTYTYTRVPCNDIMINERSITLLNHGPISAPQHAIWCSFYCNQSEGYVPAPVDPYCVYYSIPLNITIGQRSDIMNITKESYFWVTYQDQSWVLLSLPLGLSEPIWWSFSSLINLKMRSDKKYNSPPIVTLVSPLYIEADTVESILIPTTDSDNDDVRCRFAANVLECGHACPPATMPNGTILLSNCTLIITGHVVDDIYVAAIMVEDFIDSSSKIPLSSVPVQFLINVRHSDSLCHDLHLRSSTTEHNKTIDIFVDQFYTIDLIGEIQCPNNSIDDIVIILLPNAIRTPIRKIGATSWAISLTWTPSSEHIGNQVLCAVAIASDNSRSNEYWLKFRVIPAISSYSEELLSTDMNEFKFTSPLNDLSQEEGIMPATDDSILTSTEFASNDVYLTTKIDESTVRNTDWTLTEILDTTINNEFKSSSKRNLLLSEALPTLNTDDSTSVELITSKISRSQSAVTSIVPLYSTRSSLNIPEPTDSTAQLYDPSLESITTSEIHLASANVDEVSSIYFDGNSSVNDTSNSNSTSNFLAVQIAILAGIPIALCICCCCYHLRCFGLCSRRKISPTENDKEESNKTPSPNETSNNNHPFRNNENMPISKLNSVVTSMHDVDLSKPTSVTESYTIGKLENRRIQMMKVEL